MKLRAKGLILLTLATGLCLAGVAQAQGSTASTTVYRCPGPPVLYTDNLSAKEAQERGCRSIEGAPITVIQTRPPGHRAAGQQPDAGK